MTPTEIRTILDRLGGTQAEAARLIGYGAPQRISELLSGKREPGGASLILLEMLDRWPEETAARLHEIAES